MSEHVEVLRRLRTWMQATGVGEWVAALDAAIAALSAPAEEQPVAWDVFGWDGTLIAGRVSKENAEEIASRWEHKGSHISPLYAHPPPLRALAEANLDPVHAWRQAA